MPGLLRRCENLLFHGKYHMDDKDKTPACRQTGIEKGFA